jgi:hypothetical protein
MRQNRSDFVGSGEWRRGFFRLQKHKKAETRVVAGILFAEAGCRNSAITLH